MSIFPKRTVRGKTVTIHWNFNTAHLKEAAICPLVRIGVIDPNGNTTMLIEKHLLALPAVEINQTSEQPLFLNKNLPLLIIADYLSGRAKKEVLVDILQNIQSGRHYYFSYEIPKDAPLGKYTLLSEVYNGGKRRLSKTAADDFFFVEEVSAQYLGESEKGHSALLYNHAEESVPVKIIDYCIGNKVMSQDLQVFELGANEEKIVYFQYPDSYLSYNEERVLMPLTKPNATAWCIKNQQLLELSKNNGQEFFLLHPETNETYTLSAEQASLWLLADGMHYREELRTEALAKIYDDMLALGLIQEIAQP